MKYYIRKSFYDTAIPFPPSINSRPTATSKSTTVPNLSMLLSLYIARPWTTPASSTSKKNGDHLLNARAVDNKLLVALINIGTQQAAATK